MANRRQRFRAFRERQRELTWVWVGSTTFTIRYFVNPKLLGVITNVDG